VWNTKNPFDFMEMISYVPSHTLHLRALPAFRFPFFVGTDFAFLPYFLHPCPYALLLRPPPARYLYPPPPSTPMFPTPRLDGKTNFFEKKVSDYKKANVGTGEHGSAPAKSAFR
jgi:hypothetical protein